MRRSLTLLLGSLIAATSLFPGRAAMAQPEPDREAPGDFMLEFYAVDDLLPRDPMGRVPLGDRYWTPAELIEDIRLITGPAAWDVHSGLEYQQGCLVVRQRPAVHAQIARFLQFLRQDRLVLGHLELETVEVTAGVLEDLGLAPELTCMPLLPFERAALLRTADGRVGTSKHTLQGGQVAALPLQPAGVLLVRLRCAGPHRQLGLETWLVGSDEHRSTSTALPSWLQVGDGASFLVRLPSPNEGTELGHILTVTPIKLRQADAGAAEEQEGR